MSTGDIIFAVGFSIEAIEAIIAILSASQARKTGFSPIAFWIEEHNGIIFISCLLLFLFCRLFLHAEAAWTWILAYLIAVLIGKISLICERNCWKEYAILTAKNVSGDISENEKEQLSEAEENVRRTLR